MSGEPASTESEPMGAVLRRLILPVYLPIFAVNASTAMLVPILPLYLVSIGLTYTELTIVLSAAGVGAMLSQVIVGRLLDRISETKVMAISLLAIAAVAAATGVVALAVGLVALRLVAGSGSVGSLLSRQTYLTRSVAPLVRGRAMGVVGGTTRSAFLVGPILSGWIAETAGFEAAFFATSAVALSALIPLLIWHHTTDHEAQRPPRAPASRATSGLAVFREHHRSLTMAGIGQVCVIAVREGRYVILPLIGLSIGLEAGAIGALITAGSAADFVLFPISGFLMDRFGRLAAIVPSFTILGLAMFVLATASSAVGVTVAAVLLGIGNGLGSGTMLTLSSDLAPSESPAGYLAALGTIRDAGKIAGPLIVGRLADTAGLSTSAVVLGIIAFVGVAVLAFGVGETSGRRSKLTPQLLREDPA